MKKLFPSILLCSFTFLTSHAHSIEANVEISDILYIAPWSTHIDIRMSAPEVDINCGRSDIYRIDINDSGAEAKLSTLLLAFTTNKKVGLRLGGCVFDAPSVSGVRLYK